MHHFPEGKHLRWQWTQFVRQYRTDLVPSFVLSTSCFQRKLLLSEPKCRILKKGSVPTVDVVAQVGFHYKIVREE